MQSTYAPFHLIYRAPMAHKSDTTITVLLLILSIWGPYIPGSLYHTFARGAYFSAEVIPSTLAVISMNTLYFYDSNSVVDGCPPERKSGKDDPGTEQLQWLEAQLDMYRDRGMQVWVMGHVPPTPVGCSMLHALARLNDVCSFAFPGELVRFDQL